MGIKGLSAFVKQFGKITSLESFRGKTVAIDTPIFMFRFKYLCDTPTFLNRFKLQMELFKSLDIKCLYVFDGTHPVLKQETREERKKTQTIFITKEDISRLKEVINETGNNFVVAPGEAEKLCSYLNSEKIVDFVMSNDYDTFVFGCETLLVSSGPRLIQFNPQQILENLGLSKEEFLDVCVASGCDFFAGGIPGVGVKKAIKLVKTRSNGIKEWGGTDDFYTALPTIYSIFTDFTEEKESSLVVKELLSKKELFENEVIEKPDQILLEESSNESCDESDGL